MVVEHSSADHNQPTTSTEFESATASIVFSTPGESTPYIHQECVSVDIDPPTKANARPSLKRQQSTKSIRSTPSGATLRVYLQSLEDLPDEHELLDFRVYVSIVIFLTAVIIIATQCFAWYYWPEDDSAINAAFAKAFGPGYQSEQRSVTPTSYFRPLDFARYCTIFQWITCVLCGLGGEIVFGQYMVKQLSDEGGKALYMVAQLAFSLFLSVAMFAQSAFGLPFLVLGLWKGGFPETIGYFVRARNLGFGRRRPTIDCVMAFCNGMGTLIHHMSASYVICCCNTKLCPLQRDTFATCLPTIMQHWFVLTRYFFPPWLYALVQGLLEILFEWEVLVSLPHAGVGGGYDRPLRGVAMCMLIAHWFYWTSALLIPFATTVNKDLVSFRQMDEDNSGALDFDEFCKALGKLGIEMEEEELRDVFAQMDADGSGTVTLQEFESWTKSHEGVTAEADHEVVEWRQMALRHTTSFRKPSSSLRSPPASPSARFGHTS